MSKERQEGIETICVWCQGRGKAHGFTAASTQYPSRHDDWYKCWSCNGTGKVTNKNSVGIFSDSPCIQVARRGSQ